MQQINADEKEKEAVVIEPKLPAWMVTMRKLKEIGKAKVANIDRRKKFNVDAIVDDVIKEYEKSLDS